MISMRRCMRAAAGATLVSMEIRRPPPLERDDEEPQIDTPVIDMQDLRHQQGGPALPEMDLSKDDEKARKAIEEFERSLRQQPPG